MTTTFNKGENARDRKGQFLKGRKFSEEERAELSIRRINEFASGTRKPVLTWLGKKLPLATRRKISLAHKGKAVSPETRKKLSEITKRQWQNPAFRQIVVEANKGENSPMWRGGISPLVMRVRNSTRMQRWRREVRARDGLKCLECGSSELIEIDHIKPFAQIMYESNITSVEEAWSCNELWDIRNGRTLCREHHAALPRPHAYTYAI